MTTRLSVYNKFGCVSIREVYHSMKKARGIDLIKEIIWRDFYYQITYYNPYVIGNIGDYTRSFKQKYNKLKWNDNKQHLNAWKKGLTGFPFVDAGMRQMLQTGFMHNRVRMVSASLLIKTLLINWEEGEQWFAINLIDYDPSQNNGGWQWVAGTGADSQPYYRIFNPWTQSETYDKDAIYIKQWVPELLDVEPNDIHNWYLSYTKYPKIKYPKPIVDYTLMREKAIKMYKKIK
ncbi:MAG: deoxyribodipyrimidine photo-lyase [Propionibacteriaceae bacterium]|nr:deoxyribodipyrimidine photo-lyase [Propionibacteriaceae bacterium]